MHSLLPWALLIGALAWPGARTAAATLVLPQGNPPVDSLTARVDSLFAPYDSAVTPGCAIALLRNDQVIYQHGYGMASLELQTRITPHTVFDIGSMSKQFTALSVLLLQADGRLSLEDDIHRFLPELPRYPSPVRIRDLLHHVSGLRDYVDFIPWAGGQYAGVLTVDDALAALVRQRGLNFRPGEHWAYSNTNYFLLAQIVERAGGMPLRRFLEQRIFGPLGMGSTTLLTTHGQVIPGKAASYDGLPGAELANVAYNWETTGDGAVHTTVGDLARWIRNFDSATVGTAEMLRAMTQGAVLAGGDTVSYGMGLMRTPLRGVRRVWHNGASAGFRSDLAMYPDQGFGSIVLCNNGRISATAMGMRIASIYLGREMAAASETASAAPTPAAGPPVAGVYFDSASGNVLRIWFDGDHPMLSGVGPPADLRPTAQGDFQVGGSTMRVRFQRGGSTSRLIVTTLSGPATLEPVADTVPLTRAMRSAYAGSYRNEELAATWTIRAPGDALVLHVPGFGSPPDTLQPAFRDAFSSATAPIRFVRDAAGRVTGLRAWSRGMWGVLFVRTFRSAPPCVPSGD